MEHRKTRVAWNTSGHAHALTFSTYQRRPTLLHSGAAELFLQRLDASRKLLGFELWAYVIMPEHVHLVINPVHEGYSISEILKSLKGPSAKEILRRHPELKESCRHQRTNGSQEYRFWQVGGGLDRNLATTQATWTAIQYVHQNPVKRGLCESPADWPWSSFLAYSESEAHPPIPVDLCRIGTD